MKKNFFFVLLLILSIFINAQSVDEKKYLLSTNTTTFGISTLDLIDPYLSPLVYNGLGIRYDHESIRFLSTANKKFSLQNNLKFVGGIALNPTSTASMTYAGMNYQLGTNYHFQPIKGLRLIAGGFWDFDLGTKMISRNINNPVNVDLATNLNLSGVANYNVPFCKRVFGLQLAVQTPLMGCMFVPLAGASYYEMFDLGNLSNTTHFSSLHNKRGLSGTFSVDVPFKTHTLHVGMRYQGLKYTANEMVFERNELSLLIGTRFDAVTFAGRNNKAPNNFISTNE
ncbi:MAG: DUF3316 domain-containing protein [Paludibacter sp.]